MDMEHLTHYVIVRRDLPIGVAAAQIVHAAGESFALYMHQQFMLEMKELIPTYAVPEGVHAVVLSVKTEKDLFRLAFALTEAKATIVPITEETRNGELCAIGVAPCYRTKALDDVLRELRLYMPSGTVPPSAHEVELAQDSIGGDLGSSSASRQGE